MEHNKHIRLWVDDERPAPSYFTCMCLTAESAIELIDRCWNNLQHVSLDHDLGDGKTGHDVACFIEKEVHNGRAVTFTIESHSANTIGSKRIWSAIESIYRLKEDL